MKSILITSLFVLFIYSCAGNRGTIKYGENGIVVGGTGKARCEKPKKPYTKTMDASVKAEVEELSSVPSAELDAKLKTTVVKLTDYTSQGLDRDLLLYRICEMSINRGFTNEQTVSLIEKTMGIWDEELKKKELIGNLLIQANTEFDKKNYPSAKTYFDQLISLEKNNVDFYERRGFCNQAIGKSQDAIIDFSIGIKIDKKRPSLYLFRGNNYAKLGEFEKSISDYLTTIELRPQLKAVYKNLGLSYLRVNKTDKACESFKKAINIGDKTAEKHYAQHCI
ncbi:tetratricopeptide repeat protein [Tenacibaculum ovolyticum]|uniref:tetratricopeptide repeat protein n=1 Tax=Tenacibaculum ovolyticum TaxID=104270 RepID=UPI00048BAF21|nr:tetratricopeptide repeat protein [Tenacibaculum ovolyticum]